MEATWQPAVSSWAKFAAKHDSIDTKKGILQSAPCNQEEP